MASSSSSKSRTNSTLADDILIEIFTYLPLSSICKFKSLSKVWLCNFSNPNFIIKWYQINKNSLPLIQYHQLTVPHRSCKSPLRFKMAYPESHSEFMSRNQHLFSFKFLINQKQFQGSRLYLLGASNGLVLCYSFNSDAQRIYHVCNPLAQTWVSLPSPPCFHARATDFTGIFCECSSSYASCYKVVRIPNHSPSKKFNVDIFSSDLGIWETFQVSCDENIFWYVTDYQNVVIVKGVLFWIDGSKRLLVYNLNQNNGTGNHRCNLINLPDEEFDFLNFDRHIGESEGCVCYTKTRRHGREMIMSIWVLDKVKWQILHKDIPINDILQVVRSGIGDGVAPVQVLGFCPVDRNVVFLGCKHLVWGFNIQTRILEQLCLDNGHSNADTLFQPFMLQPMPTVLPLPSWFDT